MCDFFFTIGCFLYTVYEKRLSSRQPLIRYKPIIITFLAMFIIKTSGGLKMFTCDENFFGQYDFLLKGKRTVRCR